MNDACGRSHNVCPWHNADVRLHAGRKLGLNDWPDLVASASR
jgi:ribosome modulation factor